MIALWLACSAPVEPPGAASSGEVGPGTTAASGASTASVGSTAAPAPPPPREEAPGAAWMLGDPDLLCQVALDCGGVEIPDEPKVPCQLTITDGAGLLVYDGLAGVEKRGRSSSGFPKPQYNVELWTEARSLVPWGSTWRYLDDGGPPPDGWRSPGFDDSAWAAGPAPLGFGDEHQVTTLRAGQVAYYFRLAFEVDDPEAWRGAEVDLLVDDGAVVWLNEVELLRQNLPDGELTPTTPALSAVGGADETAVSTWPVPDGLLVPGTNVLAAEVHQWDATSSDLGFDLDLGLPEEDRKVDLFGLGADDDWILNGAWIDRALLRNWLAFELFSDMSPANYGPDQVSCELTLDGAHQGVYFLGEDPERGDGRIDIAAAEDGSSFIVKLDDEPGLVDNAGGTGTWQLVYPRADTISPQAEAAVADRLEGWMAAYQSDHPGDPETGVFAWLDLDSSVDLVLLEELLRNNDGWYLSLFLYSEGGGPMSWVPWDLDLTLGQPTYNDNTNPEGWIAYRPDFIASMGQDERFRQRLVERWFELRGTLFAEDALNARIDEQVARLGDAVERNFATWPFDEITFGWSGENYLPEREDFDDEIASIRAFLHDRLPWIDANIDAW